MAGGKMGRITEDGLKRLRKAQQLRQQRAQERYKKNPHLRYKTVTNSFNKKYDTNISTKQYEFLVKKKLISKFKKYIHKFRENDPCTSINTSFINNWLLSQDVIPPNTVLRPIINAYTAEQYTDIYEASEYLGISAVEVLLKCSDETSELLYA